MDYKIVEKDAFSVFGFSRTFKYDTAMAEIPVFWAEHFQTGKDTVVCGMYGVCLDEDAQNGAFTYMIADSYDPEKALPHGCVARNIPKHTWAIFPCRGPIPLALQEVNQKIFSEWLPGCKEYEIVAGFNVEMYADVRDFPKGTADENYYSEIWIPLRKK